MTEPKSHTQADPVAAALEAADGGDCGGVRSAIAADVSRGVTRLLMAQGIGVVCELPLPDGRRADIVGLSSSGGVWIVEIKSSVADFRCDTKWPTYRAYCDRLYFAVSPDFPVAILPEDAGLILADRYGGSMVREAPEHGLAAARRKVMMVRFGLAAAARLARVRDPGADGMGEF